MFTKRRIILILVVVGIALLMGLLGFFAAWQLFKNDDNQRADATPTPSFGDTTTTLPSESTITPTATATPTASPTPTPQSFIGTYVKASLPSGWTIKEYGNGQGTSLIVEGVKYKGLTGLVILYNGGQIAQMYATDGIGGNEACPIIPAFADTNHNYQTYLEYAEEAQQSGQPAPQFVDISNKTYTETTLFGNRLRRSEFAYYKNLGGPNAQFNPACSGANGTTSFSLATNPVMWTRTPFPVSTSLFRVTVKSGTTIQLLEQLDGIFGSLQKR